MIETTGVTRFDAGLHLFSCEISDMLFQQSSIPQPRSINAIQKVHFFQKVFLRFNVFGVGQAAINRADRRALRFIVEADAFGTFVRHDEIHFIRVKIAQEAARRGGVRIFSVAQFPRYCWFVNGSVGAFWLTRAAVDTVRSNTNSHSFSLIGKDLIVLWCFKCKLMFALTLRFTLKTTILYAIEQQKTLPKAHPYSINAALQPCRLCRAYARLQHISVQKL